MYQLEAYLYTLATDNWKMCIAFLAISENPHEDGYKIIIAMNRDEYFDRPTKAAQFYDGDPPIVAGKGL